MCLLKRERSSYCTEGATGLFEETVWACSGDILTNGGSLGGRVPRREEEDPRFLPDTIKPRPQTCSGWLEGFEPGVWPEITINKVWPCMTNPGAMTSR